MGNKKIIAPFQLCVLDLFNPPINQLKTKSIAEAPPSPIQTLKSKRNFRLIFKIFKLNPTKTNFLTEHIKWKNEWKKEDQMKGYFRWSDPSSEEVCGGVLTNQRVFICYNN